LRLSALAGLLLLALLLVRLPVLLAAPLTGLLALLAGLLTTLLPAVLLSALTGLLVLLAGLLVLRVIHG
jgi:hypothetical protein